MAGNLHTSRLQSPLQVSPWAIVAAASLGAICFFRVCSFLQPFQLLLGDLWFLCHRRLREAALQAEAPGQTGPGKPAEETSEASARQGVQEEQDGSPQRENANWEVLADAAHLLDRAVALLEDAKLEQTRCEGRLLALKEVPRLRKEVRTLQRKLHEALEAWGTAAWRIGRESLVEKLREAVQAVDQRDAWVQFTLCLHQRAKSGEVAAGSLLQVLPSLAPRLRSCWSPAMPEEALLQSDALRFNLVLATGILLEGDEDDFFAPERRMGGDSWRGIGPKRRFADV
eukprot:TRINITY_DN25380_c0_g1_i2.p1 TRINITY_DN25380_c0_g1~~TRINITY_DN25380_c0_g1_i2.p1  ORF type:complete len:295 (-),score=72.75 TRINITY_DN25380_c0_g1_i2:38-892(-)